MPRNHEEIIAEIQDHMRKLGGSASDWCVGTAKDSRGPFFASHRVAERDDGLIYREAFTAASAEAVRDYLVKECGLRLDLEDVPEAGRIVFAYRKTEPAHPAPVNPTPATDHPAFPKRAA